MKNKIDKQQYELDKKARSKEIREARDARKLNNPSSRKSKVKGPDTHIDWNDDKLKEKRAKHKEHLKQLAKAKKDSFKLQCITYPKFSKHSDKLIAAQARFEMMLINMKQAKSASIKQSIEDKAKHKASLAAFKETYVRKTTSGTTTSELTSIVRLKKPRNYYRVNLKEKLKKILPAA